MTYKPQIFRQGLVLILVPMTLGISLLGLMYWLWTKTETLAKEEERQGEMLAHTGRAFTVWSEAAGTLIGKRYYHQPKYSKGFEVSAKKLQTELAALKELERGTRSQSLDAKTLEKLCMVTIRKLEELDHLTLQESVPVIVFSVLKVPGRMREFLHEEKRNLELMWNQQDRLAIATKSAIALGFLGNLLLTVFLVWHFSQRISNRLAVITSNAGLLPSGVEVSNAVDGNDELSFLDNSLRKTAAALKAAREHRETIFAMVAHDVRSPLFAAWVCLETFQEYFGEACKDNQNLCEAQTQFAYVLEHVNDLLANLKQTDTNTDFQLAVDEGPALFPTTTMELQENRVLQPLMLLQESVLRPRMFHKVLFIVLVPLLVQTSCLFMTWSEVHNSEQLLLHERRLTKTIMYLNCLLLDSMKSTTAEAFYLVSNLKEIKLAAEASYRRVLKDFSELDTLVKGNEDWLILVDDFKSLLKIRLASLEARGLAANASLPEVENRFKESRSMKLLASKVYDRANFLFRKESLTMVDLQTDRREVQKTVSRILICGILADLVIAGLLLLSFSTDVRKRVNLLVENAVCLSSTTPLPHALLGNDELAYVDQAFHEAHKKLVQAASERNHLMHVLAEEISRPLLKAQLSLTAAFRQETEGDDNERVKRQLSSALYNIGRVLVLINDLLTLESLETDKVNLELSTFKTSEIVDESLAGITSLAARKGISLKADCAGTLITADRARLIQVLVNYLSNAIKFSPEHSTIIVGEEHAAGRVRIFVKDEGPGMDSQSQQRVFDKYFQEDGPRKKEGFGLGLAICRLIIQSHNGEVGVESEPGAGSKFWFEVPAKPTSAGVIQNTASSL